MQPCLSQQESYQLSDRSYDAEAQNIQLVHTSYRIKDPRKTIEFYSKVLGFRLVFHIDFPEWKFSLYFMAHEDLRNMPKGSFAEREAWGTTRKPCLEFTHNWGTENDPNQKYHTGAHNSFTDGYGHIGVMVPDLDVACERFNRLGVDFIKRPNEGRMRDVAFIRDPEGYVIEVFPDRRLRIKSKI